MLAKLLQTLVQRVRITRAHMHSTHTQVGAGHVALLSPELDALEPVLGKQVSHVISKCSCHTSMCVPCAFHSSFPCTFHSSVHVHETMLTKQPKLT